MPRKARLDVPGTLHHVIVRGIEKRRIVDDEIDRQSFVNRMGEITISTGTQIFAWALMANHVHILLKSGPQGLPAFMRRLLTGHAINYNLRHKRHGYLFQNRYKSIVCQEDTYFKELVRYIHLNPVRAGIVKDMKQLDRYPYAGHSAILGRSDYPWIQSQYVLTWFAKTKSAARKAYREFISKGLDQGRKPELVGGGLIRSMGGWGAVKALRRMGEKEFYDDRILGSGDFVKLLIEESDMLRKYEFRFDDVLPKAISYVESECRKRGISYNALFGGSRTRRITTLRRDIALVLIQKYGLTKAETARQLGISISAVSKIWSQSSTPFEKSIHNSTTSPK